MAFMTWDAKYELGIPEMDQQHHKWLDTLNEFYDHLSDTDINTNIRDLLQKVMDYTEYHFAEEEKLMEKMGYPAVADQKDMHGDIKRKIQEYQDRLDQGQMILSVSITKELKSWFKEHIMVEDKKYAELYKKKMASEAKAAL